MVDLRPSPGGGFSRDAQQMLQWLTSPAARAVAGGRLLRCGYPADDRLVDDVIGEACVGVVVSDTRQPMSMDDPVAYATRMLKDVVNGLSWPAHSPGRLDGLGGVIDPGVADGRDAEAADQIRRLIGADRTQPWLTAAALAYLTVVMYPEVVPPQIPVPEGSSGPDEAAVWSALWMAGQRDLFPDVASDATKRRRARRVEEVLAHLDEVFARYGLAGASIADAGWPQADDGGAGTAKADRGNVDTGQVPGD